MVLLVGEMAVEVGVLVSLLLPPMMLLLSLVLLASSLRMEKDLEIEKESGSVLEFELDIDSPTDRFNSTRHVFLNFKNSSIKS